MKAAEKDKPIYTTPKGAWEGGIINNRETDDKKNPIKHLNEITTDAQGNGYPIENPKH